MVTMKTVQGRRKGFTTGEALAIKSFVTTKCVRAKLLSHAQKFKRLTDVPAEPVLQDIPVSQLLDMDSIEYCGGESDNAPGVIVRKGSLEVWTPIAARLRPRIRDKTNFT